jgi:DNA-binding transcriptional MocR family regulator
MVHDNAAARVTEELLAVVDAGNPGDKLPSVRELMARHRASPVTVQTAVQQLAARGLVEVRPGRGTFIAAQRQPAAATPPDLSWQSVVLADGRPGEDELAALLATHRPEALPLSCGYFDQQLQPLGALGAAMARAARKPAAWGRQPTEGLPDLREWFANEVGGGLRAADFTICSGGQPALAAAFRGLGRPGEVVLVEAPTYLGAMAAARDAGLRVVGVPTDEHGVRPDLLAAAFRTTGARLFYCQPLHANPHGAVLSAERRAAVLDVVAEAKAFLIEDDYARGLTLDGCAPPPLSVDDNDGHVIYVRSLTKVVAPGMRLSAIGARGVAAVRLRTARLLEDLFVAGPLQHAAVEFLTSPAWPRHLRSLRTGLRQRRDALVEALRTHIQWLDVTVPSGGLHLWLRLPDGSDEPTITAEAMARELVVYPGRPWFAAEPTGQYLRLSFGGLAADLAPVAASRLADALRAAGSGPT